VSTSRARQQQRRIKRKVKSIQTKAAHAEKIGERCVCGNQITPRDRVLTGGDRPVHRVCLERIQEAQKMATAQRVQEQGIWLPGQ